MASHVTIRLKWGDLRLTTSASIEDTYPDAADDASGMAVRAMTSMLDATIGATHD